MSEELKQVTHIDNVRLGEDEKSKELLIQSYYVGLAMENFQDCEVIKRYAKETIGLLLN